MARKVLRLKCSNEDTDIFSSVGNSCNVEQTPEDALCAQSRHRRESVSRR